MYSLNYRKYPMLVEPKAWDVQGCKGGENQSCVESAQVSIYFNPRSKSLTLKNLNRLQKVKWRVNKDLVKLLKKIYEQSDLILGGRLRYRERKTEALKGRGISFYGRKRAFKENRQGLLVNEKFFEDPKKLYLVEIQSF